MSKLITTIEKVFNAWQRAPKPLKFSELAKISGLDPATDFVGADLRSIQFGKDRLANFNFRWADLTGCDFRDTSISGAIFTDATLLGAIGIKDPHVYFERGLEALSRNEMNYAEDMFARAWHVAESQGDTLAMRAAQSLSSLYALVGLHDAAAEWAKGTKVCDEPSEVRIGLRRAKAVPPQVRDKQGDASVAKIAAYLRSAAFFEEIGDYGQAARSMMVAGVLSQNMGDIVGSESSLKAAFILAKQVGELALSGECYKLLEDIRSWS